MIPPSVHQGLEAVSGLRRGRSESRKAPPVRPIADASVEVVRPHVPPPVWAMIQLQRQTGMRPGEVLWLRTRDLDRSAEVWAYAPAGHKTAHHGRGRTIHLGPRAQEVLRDWLKADPDAFLFSPAEAEEARDAERCARCRTPMTPSQSKWRRRPGRPRAPRDRYDKRAYQNGNTATLHLARN